MMPTIVTRTRRISAAALATILAACSQPDVTQPPTPTPAPTATASPAPTSSPAASPTPDQGFTIGESVEGRPIRLARFGGGPLRLLLIGGIHGGYEANTILLADEMIDYYRAAGVPPDVTLLIVPSANPDGLAAFDAAGGGASPDDGALTAPGRANARGVDLNRNWDCDWQASGAWSEGRIAGGEHPFSEPETRALSGLILAQRPAAVVFWHSALGAVLSGGCGDFSAFDGSKAIAKEYALAAGYSHNGGFGGYAITGDASNWVSSLGIPAITVELSTHDAPELAQNVAGVEALIRYLRKKAPALR